MPDDTQTGGQAPTGTQPQAGNAADPNTTTTQQQQPTSTTLTGNQSQPGAAGSTADTTTDGKDDAADLRAQIERMQKELADTRKEAAAHRVKAKELDKRIADEEASKLSDVERAQKRAEAAEAREKTTRERIGRTELRLAAKDAGIIDADDAVVHLLSKLEYDDDGEPVGVAKLVEGLKASKPHLFSGQAAGQNTAAAKTPVATSSGGATNPTRSSGPMIVTANQYLDKAFQSEFRSKHGMDIVSAVRAGKAQIV